jgi:hypothetical protein
VHPHAKYRHRKLSTADNRGVDRFNGEVETIPAGDLCRAVVLDHRRGLGLLLAQPGRHRVHRGDRHPLLGPRQAPQVPHVRDLAPARRPGGLQDEKYFRDRTSVWDGTATDINGKICEFLS